MAAIFTATDVRAFLLSEMELTEDQLGTATLQIAASHIEGIWAWDYADSMTHDWGVVSEVLVDGATTLEASLHPESSSYSDLPDDGTYSADKVMKNWD